MEEANGVSRVRTESTAMLLHFFLSDQFIGFWGSSGESQSTTLGSAGSGAWPWSEMASTGADFSISRSMSRGEPASEALEDANAASSFSLSMALLLPDPCDRSSDSAAAMVSACAIAGSCQYGARSTDNSRWQREISSHAERAPMRHGIVVGGVAMLRSAVRDSPLMEVRRIPSFAGKTRRSLHVAGTHG